MNTFIFILALFFSFMTLNDYIASIIEDIYDKKYNFKQSFYKGTFSVLLWSLFYYITHK